MDNTPIIIGLAGRAGSGKDSVRSILEMHAHFAGLAFAEPIRGMLRELFNTNGVSDEYITDRALKETPIPGLGVSYRHMAQTLGTEWGRQCMGADFWLNIAGAYLADLKAQGYERFVVSDVRFANEAAWVRAQGGVVWRVERPGLDSVRAHVSEAQDFEADAVLDNSGTVRQLYDRVLAALFAHNAMRCAGVDIDAVHSKRPGRTQCGFIPWGGLL